MKKIAVIGSGISGLTAAHLLSSRHEVTVFEANDYIGGHTATVDVELGGKSYAIDTGFIVFNDRTYPNFLKLLSRLNVKPMPTEMSFSVHNQDSGLEYNGHTLATLFAQRRNLLRPAFWRFLGEIVRFNKLGKACIESGNYPCQTLGEFLDKEGFSAFFARHYILPMGAAIWSSSLNDMAAFELKFFLRFFHNHGLLNVSDRPQWYVLKGGSRSYIPALIAPFAPRLRLSTPVTAIKRHANGVAIEVNGEDWHDFDDVVLACHSDQALSLLADATDAEREVLGALPYRMNDVVLHTDTRLLPKRRAAWASWNYRLDEDNQRPAAVTYHMNTLQRLSPAAPDFMVTLNQTEAIAKDKILRQFRYAHPVFSEAAMAAQARRADICGKSHTHFSGAYWYNGFHEDGVRSALDVCQRFGLSLDNL
ncbi:FAD-dependent oxidoreductase [Shewanella sp. JM162201]|uniref:FAD-dependent oxidoreductase n=1 Tax=Shewanella jiangmenensis TaxID=2837387 RepID=A0ABS5V1V1_9GAMM|nr:FAD-dependent oxidoreductase [Shewanella jiangmenensis]MBT1444438.1 FAD-dependent oxidoreductase [Shewanella jiangmenensis]